ncbi:MAG: DUF565 domain-containing protein [Xenococcus sp. MO_188.B8]|nr:DUF565 domain-containing protein [Xenococcus sp. MO_188.B8]
MQQTRLNSLINTAAGQIELLFRNPWRRISLNIISFLMGFFMASGVSSSAGQDAVWDVMAAGVVVVFIEFLSNWIYGQKKRPAVTIRGPLFIDVLNKFKIGLTYGLFLEAFKLNS